MTDTELLEKIKDDYAREKDWQDFNNFCESLGVIGETIENNVNQIAIRYAAAKTERLQTHCDQMVSDMQVMKADIMEARQIIELIDTGDSTRLANLAKDFMAKTEHYTL